MDIIDIIKLYALNGVQIFSHLYMCILKASAFIIYTLNECYTFSHLKISHSITFFPLRTQETYRKHCEEKFVIDMIAFQKACERFQDANTKVAILRKNSV